jgi:hypothetical protein
MHMSWFGRQELHLHHHPSRCWQRDGHMQQAAEFVAACRVARATHGIVFISPSTKRRRLASPNSLCLPPKQPPPAAATVAASSTSCAVALRVLQTLLSQCSSNWPTRLESGAGLKCHPTLSQSWWRTFQSDGPKVKTSGTTARRGCASPKGPLFTPCWHDR